jgi:hypothetical protein
MQKFKIVRFYQDSSKDSKIVRTGLTQAQAQEHCQNPETSYRTCTNPTGLARTEKYGPWFEGYTEE